MAEDRLPREASSRAHEQAEDRLLDELIGAAPDARAERLRALSQEAPELAARLRAPLAELDAGDGFLPPGGALGGALFEELSDDLAAGPGRPPSLEPGVLVGSYRVVERIGIGGMGDVYRATDTTLGRDVAIKVLPAHLDGHEGVTSRLHREARLLAALNHPNIATVYELETVGERPALVMELADGPTLAERLQQGPLPVHEAIGIARQLVDAIEAAHARGVVHRDLKPGNVKVAASGHLKVLDFGIARVLRNGVGTGTSPALSPLTTLARPPGSVLGTASYMSPEQARGEPLDQRADIWAFGCVLFEMLAGSRAFDGGSAAETMAHVLGRQPAFDLLPAAVPPAIRQLLGRCLEKDADGRLPTIAEARAFLDAAVPPRVEAASLPPTGRTARLPRSRWHALPVALGLTLGAAVSGLVVWSVMRPPPPRVARLTVPLPTTDELVTGALPAVAISPDGASVAYRARRDGHLLLFRRALGEAEPRAVPVSENAMAPFFSPDGAWIGFDRGGVLMKVPSSGGMPVPICNTGGASTAASWGDRGEIVFASSNGLGLGRVSADGGLPTALTTVDRARGEVVHAFPDVLPGGRAALFTIVRNDSETVAAVRLDTGEVTRVTEGRQARFAPSGHLLVVRGDTLWAAHFDANTLELSGEPVPVLRGLDRAGAAHFAVARNGSLAYVPPPQGGPPRDVGSPEPVSARRQLLLVQNWGSELATLAAQAR